MIWRQYLVRKRSPNLYGIIKIIILIKLNATYVMKIAMNWSTLWNVIFSTLFVKNVLKLRNVQSVRARLQIKRSKRKGYLMKTSILFNLIIVEKKKRKRKNIIMVMMENTVFAQLMMHILRSISKESRFNSFQAIRNQCEIWNFAFNAISPSLKVKLSKSTRLWVNLLKRRRKATNHQKNLLQILKTTLIPFLISLKTKNYIKTFIKMMKIHFSHQ